MFRIFGYLLVPCFVLFGSYDTANGQDSGDNVQPEIALKSLTWMEGNWSSEENGKVTEEVWLAPRGGMMLAMNRVSKDSSSTFEHLRIVEKNGKVAYLASPGGAKPTPFALKEISNQKVVFENLDNDFPQRIIYSRVDQQLTARIEGDVRGQKRAMEWTWTKKDSGQADRASGQAKSNRLLSLRTAVYRVEDLQAAKKWYSNILGIEPYFDEPFYVGFRIGNQELGLDPDVSGLVRGNNQPVYWSVSNCKEALKQLLEEGAKLDSEPQDVGGGVIVASVKDPFGNILGIIQTPED